MLELKLIWGPLISFLIGGLIGKEFYRFLEKPRVRIHVRRQVLFATGDGYFLSIKIANSGRTAAKTCIGTISLFGLESSQVINPQSAAVDEGLHEYREENYKFENPRPQFITRESGYEFSNEPLCWADLGNPHTIDINPGTTHRLDICKYYQSDGDAYYIFPSDRGWRKLRARVKADLLCGRILICPANDYPTPAYFTLRLDEEGRPRFEMSHPTIWRRIKINIRRSTAFLD